MEFSAPDPPDTAQALLPEQADSFGEGLWNVVREAARYAAPSLSEAAGCCLRAFGAVAVVGLTAQFSTKLSGRAMELAGTAAVGAILLEPSGAMIALGVDTVQELRDYGRLLLPVMASTLAASGGVSASGALYVGTAVVDSILSAGVGAAAVPLLWMILALSIGYAAVGEPLLARLRDFLRWAAEWAMKLTLYLFAGYMTVTGVVSGSADATAAKAAKIAISGAVPVVGGILSDAGEAVLGAASVLGSGAGVWGILAVLAAWAMPAIRIGAQYFMLKVCAGLAGAVGGFRCGALVGDFACVMGLALALVSTQAVLLLISTVCFLQGVAA